MSVRNRSQMILGALVNGPRDRQTLADLMGTTRGLVGSTLSKLVQEQRVKNIGSRGGTGKAAVYAITDKGRASIVGENDLAWNTAQLDAIRQSWPAMDDEALAVLCSTLGPERTPAGVAARRRVLGMKHSVGFTQAASQKAQSALQGWPRPKGDKAFLQALYEALNERREAA